MYENRPFFATIQQYLKARLGVRVEFLLRKNSLWPLDSVFVNLGDRPQGGNGFHYKKRPWYAWYPPLSVMFKVNDARPCHILKTHYQGIGTKKSKLQVAYFTLLEKGFLKKFLVPAYIVIDCEKGDSEKIIDFLGGMVFGGLGSKIKIFKFDEGKVLSLLKKGYDKSFLLNEIKVRKYFEDVLPLPKLLDSDTETGVFEEEYLPATPIRELNAQTWPLLSYLFEKLFLYYKKNDVISVSANEYQSILLSKIHDNFYLLSQVTRQKLAEVLSILSKNFTNDVKEEILLVQGHGDFWLGNILLDKNSQRLLIIDWEKTDQCSLMYDIFTLFAIYSMERGNFKLLKTLLESGAGYVPILDTLSKYQEQFSSSCDPPLLKRQFRIFLMEKICFSLSFLLATPLADHGAHREFDKWHAFIVAMLKEGMLKDPTP